MQSCEKNQSVNRLRPYRPFREDPHYSEIKKMIEDLPPDKMIELKNYLDNWLNSCK